ncbi:MAG: hypothetical protein JRJ66_03925 [Deltaproteobacteria bacterium]|nr:hypothetical protein [Deltaproteobacteria bacterium]
MLGIHVDDIVCEAKEKYPGSTKDKWKIRPTIQTTMVAMNMDMPPRRGVSFLCHLVSLGTAICPVATASFLIKGVRQQDIARLLRKTSK